MVCRYWLHNWRFVVIPKAIKVVVPLYNHDTLSSRSEIAFDSVKLIMRLYQQVVNKVTVDTINLVYSPNEKSKISD